MSCRHWLEVSKTETRFATAIMANGDNFANYSTGPVALQPTLRRSSSFDRFIPFRPCLDLEGAHHKLLEGRESLSLTTCPVDACEAFASVNINVNQGDGNMQRAMERSLLAATRSLSLDDCDTPRPPLEYARRLSLALDLRDLSGAGSHRILPFSSPASPASPSLTVVNANRSSDQWAGSPGLYVSGSAGSPYMGGTTRTPRKVRPEPDTVLLISFRNDFYCTLMDWGRCNAIGAGVKSGAYIWNAATRKCKHIQPCPPGRGGGEGPPGRRSHCHVSSVRWDKAGGRLALGYSQGALMIWDAEAMRVSQEMVMPQQVQLDCLCWWNNVVFCGTNSGKVYHFDLREKSPLPRLCAPVHRRHVCNVQLSPDESTLACGGDDGIISVWEPRGRTVITKLHAHKSGAKALAWCPWRRNVLATGGGAADGFIRIWSVSAGAVKTEIDTGMQVCQVLWSEEYRELVSSHSKEDRHELLLWTARDWNLSLLTRLHPPRGRPLAQCLSPDHTTLASASADDHLSLWKLFPKKRPSVFSTSPLNMDRAIR